MAALGSHALPRVAWCAGGRGFRRGGEAAACGHLRVCVAGSCGSAVALMRSARCNAAPSSNAAPPAKTPPSSNRGQRPRETPALFEHFLIIRLEDNRTPAIKYHFQAPGAKVRARRAGRCAVCGT